MIITGGDLVGNQPAKGFNPYAFDPSKFKSFPESQNKRRKRALDRIVDREAKKAKNREKLRYCNQIGSSEFLQYNSNVPVRPIGLGAATWAGGLYAYAPDYNFNNGETISSNLTPRIGTGVLTPGGTGGNPTFSTAGIGGRAAFDFGTTTNSKFAANWLIPIMDGLNKPCSIFVRGLRTGNESGTSAGFGSSSATDRFFRLSHSAAGLLVAAKDGSGASAATLTSTTNLGFSAGTWCVTTDGSVATLYYNGAPTNIVGGALSTTTTNPLVNFNWGTTGQTADGTDDFAGLQSFIGVTPLVLNDDQVEALDDFLLAQDVPPAVGTPCMHAGDSIARASGSGGYRKLLWLWYTDPAQDYSLDFQGPISTGSFEDNQCNAFSGFTINQLSANLQSNLGTGSPYPGITALHILIGSNDCVSGYNGATFASDYMAMLVAVYAKLIQTVAAPRFICGTVTPKDGANNTYCADAWTQLMGSGGVFDTWDAAHPSATIIRVDYFNCFGGVWNSTDFLDAVHPNYAGGYTKMANDPTYGLIANAGAYLGSISA